MKLTTVALVGGPTMLVLVSPWVAARLFEGRAPARTVATFHLLALAGMAALPLVALPCLTLIRPSDLSALASLSGIRVAQVVARVLAIAYLARIGWVAVRTSRATSRSAANLAVAAAGRPAAGGPVTHLVASARPFAYTLGGRAGGVVVSHGLLALLDRDERDAVLAHERAHLRLRHHRLLWFGQVVSAALGAAVPAAGEAAASPARELEVIAGQAAANEMGERRVVARALAKAALASATSTPGSERRLGVRRRTGPCLPARPAHGGPATRRSPRPCDRGDWTARRRAAGHPGRRGPADHSGGRRHPLRARAGGHRLAVLASRRSTGNARRLTAMGVSRGLAGARR